MKYKIILMIWIVMIGSLLVCKTVSKERLQDTFNEQVTGKLESVETPSDTSTNASNEQITDKSTTEDINRYFLQSMGQFKITVYTPYSDNGVWGYQTSSGEQSKHLRTCAVDPNILPLGSVVVVNGLTLKCVDTGGAVKGNVIDIFFDGTEAEAREWISEFGESAEVRLQYWGDYSEEHAPIK